jgi:hypothetical protein
LTVARRKVTKLDVMIKILQIIERDTTPLSDDMPATSKAAIKAIIGSVEGDVYLHEEGDRNMSGDSYVTGQAGAVGPNAHAHDMTFNQVAAQAASGFDMAALSAELTSLRQALMSEMKSADHGIALGQVAAAEAAASKGDGPSVMKHLKSAGQWALDVATKLGLALATAALKKSLHLPG